MAIDLDKVILKFKELIKGSMFENHLFAVGGCVRDKIMGHDIKDIDLCVDLLDGGLLFADWMCNTYKDITKNKCVFPTFGTAKFTITIDGEDYDIETVMTRSEQYHDKNSRNPECDFGTIEQDCFRRDLTINSLYINVSTGEVLDLTGKGIDDIKNKIIRTPCDPNITFIDDPLRMLRVCRFSSRYGWNIDCDTLGGIIDNVERIQIISKERIADELEKIFICKNSTYGMRLLCITGLLKRIIPELLETIDLEQNKYHFGDVWSHTMKVVENTKPIFKNRLAGLLHDIGKIKTKSVDENGNIHFYKHEVVGKQIAYDIMKRLKLSNDIINDVCFAIEQHMRTKPFGNEELKVSDKVIRKLQSDFGDRIDFVFDVINADNLSHAPEYCLPHQIPNIKKRIEELDKMGPSCKKIKLPINGNDIMEITGIEPGPMVKDILFKIKDMFLENPNISREECIKYLEKYK